MIHTNGPKDTNTWTKPVHIAALGKLIRITSNAHDMQAFASCRFLLLT